MRINSNILQTFENTAFSENLEIGKSGNFDVESVKKDYLLKLPFLTKNYVFFCKSSEFVRNAKKAILL